MGDKSKVSDSPSFFGGGIGGKELRELEEQPLELRLCTPIKRICLEEFSDFPLGR